METYSGPDRRWAERRLDLEFTPEQLERIRGMTDRIGRGRRTSDDPLDGFDTRYRNDGLHERDEPAWPEALRGA